MITRVDLHIEVLALPPEWARERAPVGAALEQELGAQLRRGELPSLLMHGGEIGGLHAAAFDVLSPGAEALGRLTAHAIDGSLRR